MPAAANLEMTVVCEVLKGPHFEISVRMETLANWPVWRAVLEKLRANLGARAGTIHVSEGEWLAHWHRGLDPASAVLSELDT